jgi:hypothetical protein
MVLQTTTNKVSSSLSDLGWVIPFPNTPTVSQASDKELFTKLNKNTFPKFYQKNSTQE